jgi:tetratricopeptide (TPR) repeat protein
MTRKNRMKAGRSSSRDLSIPVCSTRPVATLLSAGRIVLTVAVLSVLSCSIDMAGAQTNVQYEAAITLANGRLQRGNNPEAFSEAVKAIDIDPTRFEGYYFAAVALLRQNHPDRALSYLRDALSRAPAAHRKTVEEQVEKAERAVKVGKLVEQAQRAEVAGNLFSAASDYTEAFEIDPAQGKAGEAAARVWLVLKEPARAARVLRKISVGEDAAAREEARKRLAGMANELAQISHDNIVRGWALLDQAIGPRDGRLESAAEAFGRAIDAIPATGGVDSPHIGLAVVRASQQQQEKFVLAFRVAAQNSVVPDSVAYFDRTGAQCSRGCKRDQALAPLLCAQDVQAALQSIYGPSVPGLAREFCTARDKREKDLAEAKAREEEQRKKAEAERKARELRQAREEEQREKDLAERKAREEEQRKKDLAERKAREERVAAERLEFLTKVNNMLKQQRDACYLGKREAMTTCLCIGEYDEAKQRLSYQVKIRGTFRRTWPEDKRWGEYRHSVQGSVRGNLVLGRQDLSQARFSGTEVEAGSGQIDVKYNFGPGRPVTGSDALKSAILHAYGGVWSLDLGDGAIMLGSQESKNAFEASRTASGCGF